MNKATLLIFIAGCLTSTTVNSAPTANGSPANSNPAGNSDGNYKSGVNPLEDTFQRFAALITPYANQFVPPVIPQYGAYPTQYPYPTAGGPQFPYVQPYLPPAGQGSPGYGGYPFNPTASNGNPSIYTGPLTPNPAYGQLGSITPNPAYGQFGNGGSVPVVTTRLNNRPGVTTGPAYASVNVNAQPGEGPLFRSQTVTGSDGSYGSAFAYSSG